MFHNLSNLGKLGKLRFDLRSSFLWPAGLAAQIAIPVGTIMKHQSGHEKGAWRHIYIIYIFIVLQP